MGGVRSRLTAWTCAAACLASALVAACGRTSKNDAAPAPAPDSGGEPSVMEPKAPTPNCAVALAANAGRHCGTYQDGSVRCWGPSSEEGPSNFEASNEPQQVAGLQNVQRVVLGPRHACALLADGGLSCWGDNDSAQIDNSGVTPLPPTLTPLALSPRLTGLKGFGLSSTETCVVDFMSHVYCRGTDLSGTPTEPHQIDVAGNPDTTMPGSAPYVMDEHGRVFDVGTAEAPQMLPEYGRDNAWLGLSTTQACVLKRWGSLWCESLGSSKPGTDGLKAEIELGEGVVQAAIGNQLVCAVTGDGQAWCEGSNDLGQTGAGEAESGVPGAFVPGLANVRSISVNASSACALKSDGSVWCWGLYGKDRSSRVPIRVSDCEGQLAAPPQPQAFAMAPRNGAERLAEAGRARGQAACACAVAQAGDDGSCTPAEDFAPNAACLSAIAPDESKRWECLSQQLWHEAQCFADLVCPPSALPNSDACEVADACAPAALPAVESYCKRRTCTLDLEKSITVYQICDGKPDCNDGSDERNCTADTQFFECAPNNITLAHVCDGIADCDDSSDEIYCQ